MDELVGRGADAFILAGTLHLEETSRLEGARVQAIAETLGGAKDYGPGVLEQQWKMSGLLKPDEALEPIPAE